MEEHTINWYKGEIFEAKFISRFLSITTLDLLGHFDIKTTARYLHVKSEQLVNIVSPRDDLFSWKGII